MNYRINNFCLSLVIAALQDARREVFAGHAKTRRFHVSLPGFVRNLPRRVEGGLTPGTPPPYVLIGVCS